MYDEIKAKLDEEIMEQFKKEQIVDQVKERKFRFGMAAAELLIPLIFYASMFYSGLDFEKEGTFTSNMLRNLISRFKPTKK